MDRRRDIQTKYQYRANPILSWLVIWYLLGFLCMLILVLPTVTIWSLEESITREGISSTNIESGSIVNAFFLAASWPVLCFFLFTVGWVIAGEFVGSKNSPIVFLLYYIKLLQLYLPIFVIGFISGLITLIRVKKQKKKHLSFLENL